MMNLEIEICGVKVKPLNLETLSMNFMTALRQQLFTV